MKYKINFTRTIQATLEIDAFSEENAKEIVNQGCHNERFDLDVKSEAIEIQSVEESE